MIHVQVGLEVHRSSKQTKRFSRLVLSIQFSRGSLREWQESLGGESGILWRSKEVMGKEGLVSVGVFVWSIINPPCTHPTPSLAVMSV